MLSVKNMRLAVFDIDDTIVYWDNGLAERAIPAGIKKLNDLKNQGYAIAYCTAKPESEREKTLKVLKSHGLPHDSAMLFMIPEENMNVPRFKKNTILKLMEDYTVEHFYDDQKINRSVVARLGIPTVEAIPLEDNYEVQQYIVSESNEAVKNPDTDSWNISKEEAERVFEFEDFEQVADFISELNEVIIKADHHPEIEFDYNKVKVRTWSHDTNSFTERDAKLITAIDEIKLPSDDGKGFDITKFFGFIANPMAPGYQSYAWTTQDWRSIKVNNTGEIHYAEPCGAKGTRTKSDKPRLCLPLKVIKGLIRTEKGKEILASQARKKARAKKGQKVPYPPEIKTLLSKLEKKTVKDIPKNNPKKSKPIKVKIEESSKPEKKLMATFTYNTGESRTTHFGARGMSDYTQHKDEKRMKNYLRRHGATSKTKSSKEHWDDPVSAGALSRWILWGKPSLRESFNDYKKRFNLEGTMNVSNTASIRRNANKRHVARRVEWFESLKWSKWPVKLKTDTADVFYTQMKLWDASIIKFYAKQTPGVGIRITASTSPQGDAGIIECEKVLNRFGFKRDDGRRTWWGLWIDDTSFFDTTRRNVSKRRLVEVERPWIWLPGKIRTMMQNDKDAHYEETDWSRHANFSDGGYPAVIYFSLMERKDDPDEIFGVGVVKKYTIEANPALTVATWRKLLGSDFDKYFGGPEVGRPSSGSPKLSSYKGNKKIGEIGYSPTTRRNVSKRRLVEVTRKWPWDKLPKDDSTLIKVDFGFQSGGVDETEKMAHISFVPGLKSYDLERYKEGWFIDKDKSSDKGQALTFNIGGPKANDIMWRDDKLWEDMNFGLNSVVVGWNTGPYDKAQEKQDRIVKMLLGSDYITGLGTIKHNYDRRYLNLGKVPGAWEAISQYKERLEDNHWIGLIHPRRNARKKHIATIEPDAFDSLEDSRQPRRTGYQGDKHLMFNRYDLNDNVVWDLHIKKPDWTTHQRTGEKIALVSNVFTLSLNSFQKPDYKPKPLNAEQWAAYLNKFKTQGLGDWIISNAMFTQNLPLSRYTEYDAYILASEIKIIINAESYRSVAQLQVLPVFLKAFFNNEDWKMLKENTGASNITEFMEWFNEPFKRDEL